MVVDHNFLSFDSQRREGTLSYMKTKSRSGESRTSANQGTNYSPRRRQQASEVILTPPGTLNEPINISSTIPPQIISSPSCCWYLKRRWRWSEKWTQPGTQSSNSSRVVHFPSEESILLIFIYMHFLAHYNSKFFCLSIRRNLPWSRRISFLILFNLLGRLTASEIFAHLIRVIKKCPWIFLILRTATHLESNASHRFFLLSDPTGISYLC